MPSASTEMPAVPGEEPPSQPAHEKVAEERVRMTDLIYRLGDDSEFEGNMTRLNAVVPEAKRGYFEEIDTPQLKKVAALYTMSEAELEKLMEQPRSVGFHSAGEILVILSELHKLTGEERLLKSYQRYTDREAMH